MAETYKFADLRGLFCCDECNEITQTLFTCPVCGLESHTSIWRDLGEENFEVGYELMCDDCGAKFRLVKLGTHYTAHEWEEV